MPMHQLSRKCTNMCSFMIIGIKVIEFRFFNLDKKNCNIAFLLISHTIYNMKCLLKVKTRIFKCTGLMPSDLDNPYIHSATALCDK